MKKLILLIVFAMMTWCVSAQQSAAFEEDINVAEQVTIAPSPSLLAYPALDQLSDAPNPIYLERPSYYIQQCATCLTTGIIVQAAGGFVGGLMTSSASEGTAVLGAIITIGAEVTGFVLECCAVSSLKKAGRAMEKIQIQSNGIAINL